MENPLATPSAAASGDTRRALPRAARWLFHGSLLLAFSAVGGGLLVWPQWIAADGLRSSLRVQRERERELSDRLDLARVMNQRLREWKNERRRVYLPAELRRY